MEPLTVALVTLALFLAFRLLGSLNALKPQEARRLIDSGQAVLIDVREPGEWSAGVAAPALLLPLSDLRAGRRAWSPALEQHRGKTLVLYCASGMRSGMAARLLRREGFTTQNLGGLDRWTRAGLPSRLPRSSSVDVR